MVRRIIFSSIVVAVSISTVAAATITVTPCNKKCVFPTYEHVDLTFAGPIRKGDLAKLQKQYVMPARFQCLNRIEPGRYIPIPADQVEAWQKEWQRSHQSEPMMPISAEDAAAKKKCYAGEILNRPGYVNGMLVIGSPGGSLKEAMAIGRWVRKNRLGVAAAVDCASACVWILASGLIRQVYHRATVRIHRPFLLTDDSNTSPGQTLRNLLQESKTYFSEMGVPPELAERMFSTPPDEATTLSEAQISYYRLDQTDMGFGEELSFAHAKFLGISRAEYVKRMQLYNEWNKREPCGSWLEANRISVDLDTTVSIVNKCMNKRLKALGLR